MLKKILLYSLLGLLILLVGFAVIEYEPGIEVETLKSEYAYPESQFIEIAGMPIHCRVTGSGPNLILIHGVSSSLHTWEGWHKELSDRFRVISFDVPAFGLTGPNPKDDYSVEMYMPVIDTLLDKLGVDSCFMAGNSFGGFLTWNYALHNPKRVQKIILVDAAGFKSSKEMDNIGIQLAMHPLTRGITQVITPAFLVDKSVEKVYGDPSLIQPGVKKRYRDLLIRKGNRKAFGIILSDIRRKIDHEEQIKQVSQPTLIQWGDKDLLIDVECAYKFEKAIPGSKLIVYEGVGHVPMEEIPVQSAKDAADFLLNDAAGKP